MTTWGASECRNVVVLCGAGISTSAGIPDFRSAGGLFDAIKDDKELSARMTRPEQAFEREYFEEYPNDVLKVWARCLYFFAG